MIGDRKFSMKDRIKSFKYAFSGFKILLIEEHNARIHITIATLVILAGIYFGISAREWMDITLAITFVFAMEMANSALENLADFKTLEKNEFIKKAKDLSAGSVLFSVINAVVIGLIVFIPKISKMF